MKKRKLEFRGDKFTGIFLFSVIILGAFLISSFYFPLLQNPLCQKISASFLIVISLLYAISQRGKFSKFRAAYSIAKESVEATPRKYVGGPVKDETDALLNAVKMLANRLYDVTTNSEREKNELEAILENKEEGIVILGSDDKVIRASKSTQALLARGEKEIVGRTFSYLIGSADLKNNTIIKLSTETGDKKHIKVSFYPVKGTKNLRLCFLKDITSEVNRRSQEVSFVSQIGHELRTPLVTIQSYSQSLASESTFVPEFQRKEFMHRIIDACSTLQVGIENMLELAKIHSGRMKMEMSPVGIKEIIDSSVPEMEREFIRRKTDFSLHLPEPKLLKKKVFVYARGIGQVMKNILGNACKYTPEEGKVNMEVQVEDDKVLFSCADTGSGIDPKYHEKIFERYYRVDKDARTVPGTGLGLAIAKEILEAHNGRIWLESEVGKGSTFYFSLPLYREGELIE